MSKPVKLVKPRFVLIVSGNKVSVADRGACCQRNPNFRVRLAPITSLNDEPANIRRSDEGYTTMYACWKISRNPDFVDRRGISTLARVTRAHLGWPMAFADGSLNTAEE